MKDGAAVRQRVAQMSIRVVDWGKGRMSDWVGEEGKNREMDGLLERRGREG